MTKMTYMRLMKEGKQVVSLPILISDNPEHGDWCPYGIAIAYQGKRKSVIEIHYINHATRTTCPFENIFGEKLDPRIESAKVYSLEIVRETQTA